MRAGRDGTSVQRSLRGLATESTVVPLTAGLLLIGLSLAGVGASLPLALALGAASVAAFLGRDSLPTVGRVLGHDLDRYLRDAWTALGLAALTVLLGTGATPGELQALGGLLGLLGMVNYFLRPAYLLAIELVERLRRLA